MNLREQLEKEITEKVMIKLAQHKVELGVADEIKSASIDIQKKYKNVFSKAMSALSTIDEALKIGNSAFFEAQKFYQQGVKLEQQAKDLGLTLPSDIKKAIDDLYPLAKLEGEQIIKNLTQAKKALG